MNDYGSWTQGTRWYDQLRAIIDMKSSTRDFKGLDVLEQLRVMDDMNDSGSWAQASRYYDHDYYSKGAIS